MADEQDDVSVDTGFLRRLAEVVLSDQQCPPETEVSVILVGDEEMAGYNLRFMDRPGPTDVISLPIEELAPGRPPGVVPGGPPPMLGDVILAPGYIHRQAAETGRHFEDELALLAVHGLLHLLGYDHQDDSEAGRMEEREQALLERVKREPR